MFPNDPYIVKQQFYETPNATAGPVKILFRITCMLFQLIRVRSIYSKQHYKYYCSDRIVNAMFALAVRVFIEAIPNKPFNTTF